MAILTKPFDLLRLKVLAIPEAPGHSGDGCLDVRRGTSSGDRRWIYAAALATILASGPAISACGVNAGSDADAAPAEGLEIIVPNNPGSQGRVAGG